MEEKKIIRFQDLSMGLKIIVGFEAIRLGFLVAMIILGIILVIFGIE